MNPSTQRKIDQVKSEIDKEKEKFANADSKHKDADVQKKKLQGLQDVITRFKDQSAKADKTKEGLKKMVSSDIPAKKAKKKGGMVMNTRAGELSTQHHHLPGPVHTPTKTKTFGAYTKITNHSDNKWTKRQAESVETEMQNIEEAVTVKKDNYSWGKMVTVHHGSSTSYPLHPEHQSLIKKLKDGEKTSFKDETNSIVHAHREGDNVHLTRPKHGSTKTTIAHSHFTESHAPVAPAPTIHRVAVTVSEPDHPMVSKRDETQQKFVRINHHNDNKEQAVERAKKHYAKKGYKVHGAEHVGIMHESVEHIDLEEAKVAATATVRAGLAARGRKAPGEAEQAAKKKEHDDAWERLMAHAAAQKAKKTNEEVELDEVLDMRHHTTGTGSIHVSHTHTSPSRVHSIGYTDAHKISNLKVGEKHEYKNANGHEKFTAHKQSDGSTKIHDDKGTHVATIKNKMGRYDGQVKESLKQTVTEGAYEKAEENKRSADAAKSQARPFDYHMHMADHHDNMSQWHASKGRHGEADKHAQKSDEHHQKAMAVKEEVAANNVGGGEIAGTKGDAGKKAVMTKEPLKRRLLSQFKTFIDKAEK